MNGDSGQAASVAMAQMGRAGGEQIWNEYRGTDSRRREGRGERGGMAKVRMVSERRQASEWW
jgi:hypothetical protein